jgi:hypothetical protein
MSSTRKTHRRPSSARNLPIEAAAAEVALPEAAPEAAALAEAAPEDAAWAAADAGAVAAVVAACHGAVVPSVRLKPPQLS